MVFWYSFFNVKGKMKPTKQQISNLYYELESFGVLSISNVSKWINNRGYCYIKYNDKCFCFNLTTFTITLNGDNIWCDGNPIKYFNKFPSSTQLIEFMSNV